MKKSARLINHVILHFDGSAILIEKSCLIAQSWTWHVSQIEGSASAFKSLLFFTWFRCPGVDISLIPTGKSIITRY